MPATMGYRVPAELLDGLPAFLRSYRDALPPAGGVGAGMPLLQRVGRIRGWEAEADELPATMRYRMPAELPDGLPAFLRSYRD